MHRYLVLAEIDGGYVLVPSDSQDPVLDIKYNFCHKQDFSRTCTVMHVYDAEEFTRRVKAYWFKAVCGDETEDDLVSFKVTEGEDNEVEEILREYRNRDCKVRYDVLLMTEGEFKIARWLLDRKDLGLDGALATARALGFYAMNVLGVPIPMARR